MKKADEVVMTDMIVIMVLFGLVVQLVCLFIPGDRLRMAAGLWIGVATGVGLLVDMRSSLKEALVMDSEGATRYMQKSYAKRYILVIICFMAIAYFELANIYTLLIGVMGLKFSAYLQPIMHKLFKKVKKS